MPAFAPSKSGWYLPSAPIETVQLPDSGGRKGSSIGGAGNVNAVCPDAAIGKAATAQHAERNETETARRTVLTAEKWKIRLMKAPDLALGLSRRVGSRDLASDQMTREHCPKIASADQATRRI